MPPPRSVTHPPAFDLTEWKHDSRAAVQQWDCGECSTRVAARPLRVRTYGSQVAWAIVVCPSCACPTFIRNRKVEYPIGPPDGHLELLPEKIEHPYDEARLALAAGAFTPCVLACRNLILHIAVERGAAGERGKTTPTFKQAVDYLLETGAIPPTAGDWANFVRQRGNEATHELVLADEKLARSNRSARGRSGVMSST